MIVMLNSRVAYSERAIIECSTGGARPATSSIVSAPERGARGLQPPCPLRDELEALRSRSSTATGRSTNSELTRLPSESCSPARRMFIGTIARTPGLRRALAAREHQLAHPRRAGREQHVVDRAAELVPDGLHAGRGSVRTTPKRRVAPIGTFSVVCGERRHLARDEHLDERPRALERLARVKRRVQSARCGVSDGAERSRERSGAAGRLDLPRRVRAVEQGRRLLGALRARGRGRSCTTPTEPTPSTIEWWVFEAIAQRPSARPSSSTISHRGRVRSRRWEKNSAGPVAQLLLASGRRDGGMEDVVADVEALVLDPGRPRQPAGARRGQPLRVAGQLCQPLGDRRPRSASSVGMPPPGSGSKTITPPMCIVAPSSACSSSRKVASRALRCSPVVLIAATRLPAPRAAR